LRDSSHKEFDERQLAVLEDLLSPTEYKLITSHGTTPYANHEDREKIPQIPASSINERIQRDRSSCKDGGAGPKSVQTVFVALQSQEARQAIRGFGETVLRSRAKARNLSHFLPSLRRHHLKWLDQVRLYSSFVIVTNKDTTSIEDNADSREAK